MHPSTLLLFSLISLPLVWTRVWVKSDLPQFRRNLGTEKEKTEAPTGPRNRILEWKQNLAFEKVTKDSDVFCRIYGLCAHYSFGITVLNVLAKWKDRGMIYPYKKWDGKPDADLPFQKIENFVRTFHNSKGSRNNVGK